MIRTGYFIVLALCGIVAAYALCLVPPHQDVFARTPPTALIDLDEAPPATIATLKLRHYRQMGPVAVGIFGNSRVLMLGHAALGLKQETFFNLALSSESFFGAIALIRKLENEATLPNTLVIGLDNFILQRNNSPFWPPLSERIGETWRILGEEIQSPSMSARSVLRVLWRAYLIETIRFKMTVHPTLALAGAEHLLGIDTVEPASDETGGYRRDGSHQMSSVRTPKIVAPLLSDARIDLRRLRAGLEYLGQLVQQGKTVYIFETPLHPDVLPVLLPPRRSYVQDMKHLWHEDCRRLGLKCVDAPLIADAVESPWADASHPPEKPWGAFIANHLQVR